MEKADSSDTKPVIEWVSHPAKKRPLVTVLVTVFILLIAIGIYTWTYSLIFTALTTMILICSLAGFYFPIRYQFFDNNLMIKYTVTTIKKEWSQFRSYYADKNGVLLSPFPDPSRLENFRGVFLRYGYGDCDREKIVHFVKSKIKRDSNGS